jgi:hypothetical protein
MNGWPHSAHLRAGSRQKCDEKNPENALRFDQSGRTPALAVAGSKPRKLANASSGSRGERH